MFYHQESLSRASRLWVPCFLSPLPPHRDSYTHHTPADLVNVSFRDTVQRKTKQKKLSFSLRYRAWELVILQMLLQRVTYNTTENTANASQKSANQKALAETTLALSSNYLFARWLYLLRRAPSYMKKDDPVPSMTHIQFTRVPKCVPQNRSLRATKVYR